MQGGTLWWNSKIFEKSRIVPKKPKGRTLWSRLYFWKHKKICGSVRESNPRSPASQKISWTNEQKIVKKWTIQSETVGWKRNKTRTSKVGAISKAQKAHSFLNMPRMYSWKALKTLLRHPKSAFHARYDWKITFPDWKQKKIENFFEKFFLKKLRKRLIVPKNEKGEPFGIH